jgi:hypothetical protein
MRKPILRRLTFLLLSIFLTGGLQARQDYSSARAAEKMRLRAARTGPQSRDGFTYKTYSNARYRYSVSYPEGLLIPQGESDNGDGQKFLSKDGRAEMRVFGFHNLDGSLEDAYQAAQFYKKDESTRHVVTYKVLRKSWFVVSGLLDGRIFYLKTILRGPVFKSFVLEYDESQKAAFDPVVARIAQSFKG